MTTKTTRNISNVPEWVNFLEDYFGVRMYGNKHERWIKWMADKDGLASEPSEDDILSALKFAYEKGKTAGDKFTVDRLMMWIRWYRKEHAAAWRGSYVAGTPEARIAEAKSKMTKAESWTERWNTLCNTAKNIDECYELESWARDRWPEYDTKIREVKRRIMAEHRAVWQNMGLIGKQEGAT